MPARPCSIELITAQVVKPAAAVPPKEPNGDAPQGNHTTKARPMERGPLKPPAGREAGDLAGCEV